MHAKVFSRISGLYSLSACGKIPLAVTNVSGHCHMFLGAQNCPQLKATKVVERSSF